MYYTVGEMAKLINIPASTLRYYDKEGLLPLVERSQNGIRMFKASDFEWLNIIICLKKTGMTLKDIKKFIAMELAGDQTIEERLSIFKKKRDSIAKQLQELEFIKQILDDKCWYYQTAQETGAAADASSLPPEKIPLHLQAIHKYLHRVKDEADK